MDSLKDEEFYGRYGYSSMEEYVEKEQLPMYYKDGYCKIQLRELMSVFWEFIWRSDIFKDNKIYFIESNDDYALWAKKVSSEMNERLLDVLN